MIISSLHQFLWFWLQHSLWLSFDRGLFWGIVMSFTATFSAACGGALTRIEAVEQAIASSLSVA